MRRLDFGVGFERQLQGVFRMLEQGTFTNAQLLTIQQAVDDHTVLQRYLFYAISKAAQHSCTHLSPERHTRKHRQASAVPTCPTVGKFRMLPQGCKSETWFNRQLVGRVTIMSVSAVRKLSGHNLQLRYCWSS
jgi:hypothetical protein